MNLRNLKFVVTAVTLALLVHASPAMAKQSKTARFTAAAVGVLTATDSDGDASVFALTGTATGMGAVTGETFNRILNNTQQDGIFFFQDANGNVLIFSYKIKTVGAEFVGDYQVEFGTGRFAGAKGDGELIVAPTDVPGTVTVTLDGELTTR